MKTFHKVMYAMLLNLLSLHLMDASSEGDKIVGYDGNPVVYAKPHRPSFYLHRPPKNMDISSVDSSSHLVHMDTENQQMSHHAVAHHPHGAVRGMLHVDRSTTTRQMSVPTHKMRPIDVSSGAMVSRRHARKKPKQMDALSSVRAEICYMLKKDDPNQGESGCMDYMESVCKPGEDMEMDGDPQEYTTAKGYCKQFFPDLAGDDEPDGELLPPPVEEKEEEADDTDNYYSPLPPGPAPGPAPSRAPFEMHEELPIAEQGFMGEKVAHDDRETMTSDWQKEFGPNMKHKDTKAICKKYPWNRWCRIHGYLRRKKAKADTDDDESVAAPKSIGLHVIAISALASLALAQ